MNNLPDEEEANLLDSNDKLESNKELEDALNKIDDPNLAKTIRQEISVRYAEHHSGPLPHPRIIKQYEQILPGAADRIISMAERQMQHRIKIEESVVMAGIQSERLGLWLGFSSYALQSLVDF